MLCDHVGERVIAGLMIGFQTRDQEIMRRQAELGCQVRQHHVQLQCQVRQHHRHCRQVVTRRCHCREVVTRRFIAEVLLNTTEKSRMKVDVSGCASTTVQQLGRDHI